MKERRPNVGRDALDRQGFRELDRAFAEGHRAALRQKEPELPPLKTGRNHACRHAAHGRRDLITFSDLNL